MNNKLNLSFYNRDKNRAINQPENNYNPQIKFKILPIKLV